MYTIFLSEKRFNTNIWSLDLNNVELLAGMLAVSIGIMEDVNYEVNNLKSNKNNPLEYYLDSTADVSFYRLIKDIPEANVAINTPGRIKPGQCGIWLKGSRRFFYSLYVFETNSFFQGIITMCNAFQVDFRSYIYDYPFDYLNTQYTLEGYIMPQRQIAEDALDLDDVDDEARDNENLIELLHKDD